MRERAIKEALKPSRSQLCQAAEARWREMSYHWTDSAQDVARNPGALLTNPPLGENPWLST